MMSGDQRAPFEISQCLVSLCELTRFLFFWQTAFSDFLMGSSRDLAKHIKVVVSQLWGQQALGGHWLLIGLRRSFCCRVKDKPCGRHREDKCIFGKDQGAKNFVPSRKG